jgi:hypothetical protein
MGLVIRRERAVRKRACGALHVAEVKSITTANEEKQLRLGLGQVLRYRHLLSYGGRRVVACLVAERQPTDASWTALCTELGITLMWPGAFRLAKPARPLPTSGGC